MPLPVPPDTSWGYTQLYIASSTKFHEFRLHHNAVLGLSGGNFPWAVPAAQPTVNASIAEVLIGVAKWYPNTFQFTAATIYKNDGGGSFSFWGSFVPVAPVAFGPSAVFNGSQVTFNFINSLGFAARVTLFDTNLFNPTKIGAIGLSGSPYIDVIVPTGGDANFVARQGGPLGACRSCTTTMNKRQRRNDHEA